MSKVLVNGGIHVWKGQLDKSFTWFRFDYFYFFPLKTEVENLATIYGFALSKIFKPFLV